MKSNTSYTAAISKAAQNIKAILWFKDSAHRCASYDKGKFCSICFDDKMTHVLTKCAYINGRGNHFIVNNHDANEKDPKVWHRPKEAEGIPNIFHADAVCSNINVTCGECFSVSPGNYNHVNNNHHSSANPGTYCFRAHCVESTADGKFTIGNDHHSRVVCPFQFNSDTHRRVYNDSVPKCKHYHFDDVERAKSELELFTKALIAVCPDIFFNLNMKSLCFMFGCYMEQNNDFRGPSRGKNAQALRDIIYASPERNYTDWMFLFTKSQKEVHDAYSHMMYHYDDCNIINPGGYPGAAFTMNGWDPHLNKYRKMFHTRILGAGREDDHYRRPVYANLDSLVKSNHRYQQLPPGGVFTFHDIVDGVNNVNSVMLTQVSGVAFQNLWVLAGGKESQGIKRDGMSMMRLYDIIDADNNPPPVTKTEADKGCVNNEVSTNAASSSHGPSRYATNADRWSDEATETESTPDADEESTPDAVDETTPDADEETTPDAVDDESISTVSSDGKWVTFKLLMKDTRKGTQYVGSTPEGHLIYFVPHAFSENSVAGAINDTESTISTVVASSRDANGVVRVVNKTKFAFSGTHMNYG